MLTTTRGPVTTEPGSGIFGPKPCPPFSPDQRGCRWVRFVVPPLRAYRGHPLSVAVRTLFPGRPHGEGAYSTQRSSSGVCPDGSRSTSWDGGYRSDVFLAPVRGPRDAPRALRRGGCRGCCLCRRHQLCRRVFAWRTTEGGRFVEFSQIVRFDDNPAGRLHFNRTYSNHNATHGDGDHAHRAHGDGDHAHRAHDERAIDDDANDDTDATGDHHDRAWNCQPDVQRRSFRSARQRRFVLCGPA